MVLIVAVSNIKADSVNIRIIFLGHVVAVCGNLRKLHLLQQICSTSPQNAAKRPNIKLISAFCTLQKSNRINCTNCINHINRINRNYINYIIIYIL